MDENTDDPVQREYLVVVDWTDNRPISGAF